MSTVIRINKELAEKARELAEQKGITPRELIESVLQSFFSGCTSDTKDETIKSVKTIKNWRLMYPTTCAICNKEIKAGEITVREIIELEDGKKINRFYHPECYEHQNDRILAKRYIKKRELEKIIKELEKKARELADIVSEGERWLRFDRKLDEINSRLRDVYNFMLNVKNDRESMEKIREIMNETREIKEILEEIRVATRIKIGKKSKKEWYRVY